MSIFRVHCIARANPWSKSFFTEMEKLFSEVCRHSDSVYKEASAYWWTHRPVHQLANEPFVWLLANKNESLIKKVYNVSIPSDVGGYTYWNANIGVISEIYLDHPANEGSANQAKLAFHELMHNKLEVGQTLHGSTYGFGLNKEILDFSTAFSARLDPDNIRWMAPALGNAVKQWAPPFS